MSIKIKILHSACCSVGSPIKRRIENIAAKHDIKVEIEELSDLSETIVYGTSIFPSLVVNGKVYDYKQYHEEQKLLAIL